MIVSLKLCSLFTKAFSKKMVSNRKDWLTAGMEERTRRRELGMPEIYLYATDTRSVSYTDFVNKELILFSNADNERSIPSLVDGNLHFVFQRIFTMLSLFRCNVDCHFGVMKNKIGSRCLFKEKFYLD